MKIVLQKWGAEWCGPCLAMAKKGTLDKFAKEHPEVKVEIHDDTENGSKSWEKKADDLNIKNLPTLIWLAGGEEILRTSAVSASDIEKQYAKVLKQVGE